MILNRAALGQLHLGDRDRISVYRHNPKNDTFVGVARHAGNPTFKLWRRRIYPAHLGCIAEAWQHTESILDGLPVRNKKSLQPYLQKLRAVGIKYDEVTWALMRMPSRSYFAHAIHNHDSRKIAVLVLESESPALPIAPADMKQWLQGDLARALADVIERNIG